MAIAFDALTAKLTATPHQDLARSATIAAAIAAPSAVFFASWTPSFPTRDAPRLLHPLVHLRSLRLLQVLHLDVAGASGGSERRRRVEFRAAQEEDIQGDVVGDHLNDPPEFRQSVVRPLRLDGVVKPGDCLADQFVQ